MPITREEIGAMVDVQSGLIDRRLFGDEELYQLELERISPDAGSSWLTQSEIPNPNDFITTYMGEDPVLLTRDKTGKIGAFLNVCRHRRSSASALPIMGPANLLLQLPCLGYSPTASLRPCRSSSAGTAAST